MWHAIIGFIATIIYFGSIYYGSTHFIRYKLTLYDPLQVMAIHLYGTLGPILGLTAAVAAWKLGSKRESIENEYDPNQSADKINENKDRLPPVEHAARSISYVTICNYMKTLCFSYIIN